MSTGGPSAMAATRGASAARLSTRALISTLRATRDPPRVITANDSCRAGRLPRRHHRPQGVPALAPGRAAELGLPVALAAELRAPRPEPSRDEVQRVLVG